MKLALAQLRIDAGDVAGNRGRALEAIETAADRGADLVVLPEIFNLGYFAFDRYVEAAESIDSETISAVADAASEHGVYVLAGSIVEDLAASAAAGIDTPAADGLANTAVLLDREGKRRAVYRKHHLFGYESAEQELLTPGEQVPTAELAGFTVGITTCYDLRFPELYRRLAADGATLVLVPSAWPYPRIEHWKLLPRARAVENLSYVAATNGVGEVADAELLGRSTIYDPWGTTVAAAGDERTILMARLDPDRVDAVRDDFPALGDRREAGFYPE